jgi:hypothetical protein
MRGSEFLATYGKKGFAAWEAAAVDLASRGSMVDWGWEEVTVKKGDLTGVLRVQRDVFAIGAPEDCIRLPLTPERAQQIANEHGWMLETPLIAYVTWRAAGIKLPRQPMSPNKGADLNQIAEHSRSVDNQVAGRQGLVAGHKKSVVVGNLYKPGKVLIFGWYKPEPDVFDDKTPLTNPERQPRQPYSNVHGNFYLDYSHGIRFVAGTMTVNGRELLLADVMSHPLLSTLVSHEGPLRMTRYPASNKPKPPTSPVGPLPPIPVVRPNAVYYTPHVPNVPGLADLGLQQMIASKVPS